MLNSAFPLRSNKRACDLFAAPQPFSLHSADFNQGMQGYPGYFDNSFNAIREQHNYRQFPYQPMEQPKAPITIGSSVMGIKFNGGVSIAADNKVSFGMLARYTDIERVLCISDNIIMGAYGNFADFQQIKLVIERQILEDKCYNDGHKLQPRALYNWLRNMLHNQRSAQQPLYVNFVIGGIASDGERFLGCIDLRGLGYEVQDVVAIGSSKILAKPVISEKIKCVDRLSKDEACNYLKTGMEILYYRDTTSMGQFSVATVTKNGSIIEGPMGVNENWKLAKMIIGY